MDNSTNVAKYAVKFSHQYKDMFFITFGILMYAFGYTAFILPEHVVMGGVAGISALLFYAFKLPPGIAIWVLNLTMLVIAYRALSKQFVIRTVIGVTILSSLVGVLQPLFEQYPVITPGEDKFMHVLIGGALGGAGLGIVFSHNGSTGGTDIIVALLNKYTRMSFGRAMQTCDICIICSSYFLFHSLETIVYGVAFTLIASFVCDYVVNGTRQTVQFIIISKKYDAIADTINNSVHRGVTLIKGTGWYSKSDVQILIVLARKYESQDVFNLIKRIDPMAMVSQSFCQGVFGSGFDTIK
ncbi:MAG: YitT family protein [Prevotella sp.]|uniref:YitT family protein n=1 Tax=Prevotella sp. P3-122 TaxID=2024223 RepID=UPI000B9683E8|nr:YitT family protein [Prevotella sp. P3-122]MCI6181781.1 YitT family protein [Prevotella sp.]MCI6461913.1 YitT family protein [Prevotella sp.]MCI6501359.1 YitT family protein [Prevotella sp.]MCI6554076.1 YitT family protein [Prevotella sp.]MCI7361608.1 YitT family protein [Prevotella sp.]